MKLFTEYLIKNGWIEINFMTYQFQKDCSIELFFDTSNQIELTINNIRKSDKYIATLEDLLIFLSDNGLK